MFEGVFGRSGTGIPGQVIGNVGAVANKPDVDFTDRLHEAGHFFGLADGDGGIMSKTKKHRYASASLDPFPDPWCKKIAAHLGR